MRIVPPLAALLFSIALGCARQAPPPKADPSAASPSAAAAPLAKVGGCRNVHLYGANEDATQVVVVDVDAQALGLKKGVKRSFDLASAPSGVRVWLDLYLQPAQVDRVHCTKTPSEPQMAERYGATAGTLTIELVDDGVVNASVDGATFALEGRPVISVAARRFERIRVS